MKHGPGAILKWKPVRTTVVGEGGVMTVEKSREYYYTCDLGLDGQRRLRQPKLSFTTARAQIPRTDRLTEGADTSKGDLGIVTSKEGQNADILSGQE